MTTPTKVSAGLLMYRGRGAALEVLLAHPGGPIYVRRDHGWWTIPKGVPDPGEDLEACARREFAEETGIARNLGPLLSLGTVKQKGGKLVYAWAFEGDCDITALKSNTFEIEWPPKSGKTRVFPEIDRFEFFDPDAAKAKINDAQAEFVDRLVQALKSQGDLA
jgi:predicted NUDIX family NTP pyrophosphohydrolase